MGNHKFNLSDMIPNTWFYLYKLKKNMPRTRNQNTNHHPPIKKKKHPTTRSSSSPPPPPSSSYSSSTSFPPNQSKTEQPHLLSHQRKSYYFTRDLAPPPPPPTHDPTLYIDSPKSSDTTHFQDSQRKSSKQSRSTRAKTNRPTYPRPPPPQLVLSAACTCRATATATATATTTTESASTKPDSTSEEYPISPLDTSDEPEFDLFGPTSELLLPPIITKTPPTQRNDETSEINERKKKNSCVGLTKFEERNALLEREQRSPVRRHSVVSSAGLRIRTNSPRIGSRRFQGHGGRERGRRSGQPESFAVVKSSADPQKDFRESMVEMILAKNIRSSKDLEDLLACYLHLNSDEYHGVIIKVFKQIWFDFVNVRLK